MLTVDLGNSRLKARAWPRSAGSTAPVAWNGSPEDLGRFEDFLRVVRPRLAALASVAALESTERIRSLLARACERVLRAPPTGLENRCAEPESVGEDRLYGALGAVELQALSCIVVDVGTAMTVDAVRVTAEARSFLGGAIALGPALAARALSRGTARLPEIQPRPGAAALGRTTREALQAGIVVGFRGAARELVDSVAREAGLGDAPVVLTGGAVAFLLEPGPFTARRLRVEPELVHLGLKAAALRALAGEG